MKLKSDKDRLEEIQEFYRVLEQKSEEFRKYFAALATLPSEPPQTSVSIEYGNTSVPRGELENAGLKSTLKRD